ncbi:O-antigen polysaccharide polymerase Wzy [Petroclostridium sp. X23]|uniref:O-antigen polysaccharide polymerase Wzy n=1 Tax=Petroclostridium sp. X23 TaxID=3045146 RepID=UPI0024ACB1E6|nr:O-antigen polysaccharide polymerase Wzy [Petroclostridium sp. X23]WHH57482.1 O-antigen polysaccharide polymerase Wzy [Petroclostridium sp. X23]
MTNLMDISVKRMKSICIYITYLIGAFIIAISFEYSIGPKMELIGLLGWGLLSISLVTWKIISGEIASAYIFFLGVLYLFFFGQSLLMPFDLITPSRNLLIRHRFVNGINLYNAQIYSILCLASFHLGALIFYKNAKILGKKGNKYLTGVVSDKPIVMVGIILLLISIIPFLYEMVQSLIIVKMYGYKGYAQMEAQTGISSLISKIALYFIPSLICLAIGVRKSTGLRKVVQILSCVVIALILYIGERNDALVFILALILIQHYFVKEITIKTSYKYIVFGAILLILLSVIADTRGLENRSLLDYFKYMLDNGFSISVLTEIFSELGSSMMPTIAIMEFVNSGEPLRYGKTYLFSVLSIIPNLGFWDLHPAAEVASLGQWLKLRLGLSYGPGFSLAAESYLNFAWWGWSVFIFLGGFIVRILGMLNKTTAKYYPEIGCFVLVFFNSSLFYIRDTFIGNVRAIFYMGLPIYMLILFFNQRLRKQNNSIDEQQIDEKFL